MTIKQTLTSTSLVATFVVSLSGRVMLRFRPIVVRRLVLMVGSLLAEATFSGLIRVSGLVLLLLAILFGGGSLFRSLSELFSIDGSAGVGFGIDSTSL